MSTLFSFIHRDMKTLFSIIHRERLFANPVRLVGKPHYSLGFIFEAVLALSIWIAASQLDDLAAFASNQPAVSVPVYAFRIFGNLGFYGVRLAMFIAIVRRNRSPQILEWIVTLLGLGVIGFFFLFGGLLLDGYAGLHGYSRCPAKFRATQAVFVREQTPCPQKGSK